MPVGEVRLVIRRRVNEPQVLADVLEEVIITRNAWREKMAKLKEINKEQPHT